MRSSMVRYLALGVLVAGLAAIVWTAVRGDGGSDDPAASPATADDRDAAATTAAAPETTVAAAGDPETAVGDATDFVDDALEAADPVAEAPEAAAPEPTVATTTVPPEPIGVLGTADTLTNLDGWLNTDATSLEEIRATNRLTVVQFWTFGCRNCKYTLDALGQLYTDFRDRGVEIVGVHSPEFSYEADVDNIIEAAADLGVVWPIALDTDKRNFHRWQPGNIGYWPRVYVIDGDNQIRFDRTGDGRATYEKLYETVEQLLTQA
ncbi:MAG: redoxin domain-containing protein [Acidimicrobiaceae bacterium]|nr:redoxin domain-containing protein [Acidimicrobiaceae bacterium]MYE97149.1 redoxin domain-containing protein [Acidimicrobiaceae bacterium]MYI54992.1 redoxin domain-containing protein [Acidimicrobiaceae bacterium]